MNRRESPTVETLRTRALAARALHTALLERFKRIVRGELQASPLDAIAELLIAGMYAEATADALRRAVAS